MPEQGEVLPEEVRRLLAERIESIAQLEVLLLLHRTAPREWDAGELSGELRIEPAWAAELLALLERAQFLAPGSRDGAYRFEPVGQDLAKAVESLAAAYADRRVAVVAQLYSRPLERIRVFADAFRIRREDSDG